MTSAYLIAGAGPVGLVAAANLVVSTPFDFRDAIPDLVLVSYLADPMRWR